MADTGMTKPTTTTTPKSNGKGITTKVSERTSELAHRAQDGIDSATTRVGEGLESAADSVVSGAQAVATRMSDAGNYLKESEVGNIGTAMTDVIKRHPKKSLAIALGAGFFLGRRLFR